MDNKTLSFAKNGEDPQIAFHNVDAPELFPCVLFYSNNPGEKVHKILNSYYAFEG